MPDWFARVGSMEITGRGAPRWLWVLVVGAGIGLSVTAGIGVVLAMLGLYRWWIVLPLAFAASVPFVPVVGNITREEAADRAGATWAVVAAVALLAVAGWSASRPGHHIITSHDPGVYANTAKLLQRTGSLRTPVGDPVSEPLVAATIQSSAGASVAGPGAYEVEPGMLEYQFSHAPSVLTAMAGSVGGTRLLFGFSALVAMVGLLAVYLLATRFVPPAFAFAATVALALSIPVLYVSRSTYSEPFTLLVVNAALALVCRRGPLDVRRAVIAGALFGSSVLFRIDGQLIVIAMIAVGAVMASSGTPWRPLAVGLVAAIIPAGVGVVDLAVFSTPYWENQNTYGVVLLLAAIIGTVAAAGLTMLSGTERFQRGWTKWLRRLAGPASALTGLVLGWAWLVRPSTQVARAGWVEGSVYADRVEGLQAAVGLAADGTRSYAELTVASIGWYFGPLFVALAVIGFSLMVWRSLARPSEPWGRLVAFFVVAGAVYLVDWQITPYQPWAARRFVTVVLPVFAIAAAVAATEIVAVVARWLDARRLTAAARSGLVAVVTAVLIAAMIVPTIIATWPVRDLAEQRGFFQVVERSCEATAGQTVLGVGSDRMAIPMRAWCDVPTVSITGSEVDVESVRQFVDDARALCVPAAVVVSDAAARPFLEAARSTPGLGEVVEIAHTNTVFPEESVVEAPSRYLDQTVTLAIASVELPESC